MKAKRKSRPGFNDLQATSGSGFISSNYIRHLNRNSAVSCSIISLDELTYAENPENLHEYLNLKKGVENVKTETIRCG